MTTMDETLAPGLDAGTRREIEAFQRRRSLRLELGLAAHCQIDGVVSQESLGDLSEGGLYLRISRPVGLGVKVRVVLGLPYIGGQRVCSLSGTVVWSDRNADGSQRGVGVQFDHETDAADRELVEGFLALWMPPGSMPGVEL